MQFTCRSIRQSDFFPENTNYKIENEHYWSSSSWLSPACVFAPANAAEVSRTIQAFKEHNVPFAVRGSGHMAIDGYANINSSSVLLSTSNLATLELSADQSTVVIGPGNLWEDVYQYLEPYDLTTIGARMGIVGVPGFLLGGGVTFLSNQHGFASANVLKFECVLADGNIVEATQDNEYSDLYWALKGGGNSFCIVTKFVMKTFISPAVWGGDASYESVAREEWIESVYNFALNADSDPKAAIKPSVRYDPT